MDIDLKLLQWQVDFLESDHTIKALSGASDTGKSWVCRLDLILDCLKYPMSHHFATATTWTQTFRSIIEPIEQLLIEQGIDHRADVKRNEGLIQFCNGSRIEMFSSDKMYNRLRSWEFCSGFMEEASTIEDKHMEKIFPEAVRRLRQPKRPEWKLKEGENPYCLRLATNPDLKTRWLFQNLFETPPPDAYVKQMTFYDGFNVDDKEREAKILMGSQRQQDFFLWGKWGALEGQAFALEEGKHIQHVNTDDLEQFYITFDYGFHDDNPDHPPMVYLLCAGKGNTLYALDEITLDSIPVNRHEQWITHKDHDWYDKYNIIGYTGETATGSGEIRDLFNKKNIHYLPTDKKRHLGWTTMVDLFDLGRLIIDPKCVKLIKSLSGMCWVSSTKGVDCEGEYDDPADALRYFVNCPWIKIKYLKQRDA